MRDDIMIARKGNAKIWKLNHIKVNSSIKPLVKARLPEYDEKGRNIRNIWIDLFNSPKYGDYIYIQETKYVEGEGWTSKGGMVLPIHMVMDFVFNLLKVAIRSKEFRKENKEYFKQIEDFIKNIAPYIGLIHGEST